jgi:hypothetical protein
VPEFLSDDLPDLRTPFVRFMRRFKGDCGKTHALSEGDPVDGKDITGRGFCGHLYADSVGAIGGLTGVPHGRIQLIEESRERG